MPPAFPPNEIHGRLRKFRAGMREAGLDGFLVTDEENVRYLSGFAGDESWLYVPLRGRTRLLTDFRYVEEAGATCVGAAVVDCQRKKASRFELVAAEAARSRRRAPRMGVERAAMSVAELAALKRACGRARKRWKIAPRPGAVEELRVIKSPAEVRLILKALRIQEEAYRKLGRWLKPGVTELFCAARLEYEMKMLGADAAAFPIIVAEGPRASLPHAAPTSRKLRARSALLVDWGARYRYYNSDLTRVFFPGSIRPGIRRIYEIVLEAQRAAIDAVRPGVSCREVDAAARDRIADAGYGRAFGHGTGHGLGLRIHEGPRLNRKSEQVLEPGMVVTVEPGIYLPGKLGVRIEDDVLVTPRGRRVLSRLPKDL